MSLNLWAYEFSIYHIFLLLYLSYKNGKFFWLNFFIASFASHDWFYEYYKSFKSKSSKSIALGISGCAKYRKRQSKLRK